MVNFLGTDSQAVQNKEKFIKESLLAAGTAVAMSVIPVGEAFSAGMRKAIDLPQDQVDIVKPLVNKACVKHCGAHTNLVRISENIKITGLSENPIMKKLEALIYPVV